MQLFGTVLIDMLDPADNHRKAFATCWLIIFQNNIASCERLLLLLQAGYYIHDYKTKKEN